MSAFFSIVSVTFNNLSGLKDSAASLLNQSFQDWEYIIVDGDSADGTKEYLASLAASDPRISFVSEKDQGIYDAMNKGTQLSRGQYINFLNGGDLFYQPEVLSAIYDSLHSGPDVIYSDSVCKYSPGNFFLKKTGTLRDFYKGMPFVHQSSFVRVVLAKQYPFSLEYKIASDFNFFCTLRCMSLIFQKHEGPIAIYEANGLSDTNRQQTLKEYRVISQGHFEPAVKISIYFLIRSLREKFVLFAKRLITKKVFISVKRKLSIEAKKN